MQAKEQNVHEKNGGKEVHWQYLPKDFEKIGNVQVMGFQLLAI